MELVVEFNRSFKQMSEIRISPCVCNNQLVSGKLLNGAQICGGLIISISDGDILGNQKKSVQLILESISYMAR